MTIYRIETGRLPVGQREPLIQRPEAGETGEPRPTTAGTSQPAGNQAKFPGIQVKPAGTCISFSPPVLVLVVRRLQGGTGFQPVPARALCAPFPPKTPGLARLTGELRSATAGTSQTRWKPTGNQAKFPRNRAKFPGIQVKPAGTCISFSPPVLVLVVRRLQGGTGFQPVPARALCAPFPPKTPGLARLTGELRSATAGTSQTRWKPTGNQAKFPRNRAKFPGIQVNPADTCISFSPPILALAEPRLTRWRAPGPSPGGCPRKPRVISPVWFLASGFIRTKCVGHLHDKTRTGNPV